MVFKSVLVQDKTELLDIQMNNKILIFVINNFRCNSATLLAEALD